MAITRWLRNLWRQSQERATSPATSRLNWRRLEFDVLEDRTLPSGLIALWHADGDVADSVGTHSGALTNGATFADGRFGQAFQLDGNDDYITVPDSPSWAFGAGDFSIVCWVNLVVNHTHTFVANDEGSGDHNKWFFCYRNSNLEFHINTTAGQQATVGAPVGLALNEWHQVAVTHTGVTFTFFADGILLGQAASNATVPDANAPLTFGKGDGATNIEQQDFLHGRIDEVGIYDRALSAQEIQNLFNTPVGPVALWHADGNAIDSAGANSGTLVGDTVYAPGIFGQAFSFDGSSDYVDVPDSAALDVSSQFTLEAWINPSGFQLSAGGGAAVIAKIGGIGGNNGYSLGIDADLRALDLLFNAPGEDWGSNFLRVPLANPLPIGQWSYIVATFDGTFDGNNERIFLNGELVGSQNAGLKSVVNSASHLRISGDDNNAIYFKGLIDEPAVYSRALSATEIHNHFVAQTPQTGADLEVAIANAPAQILVGDRLTYNVTVTNHGPDPATNVMLSDDADGPSFFSTTIPIGTLASGQSKTLAFAIRPSDVGALINTATVTADETDGNLANNTFTATTAVVRKADLTITQTAAPNPVTTGDNVTYALTINNAGPYAATNVLVHDPLPAGMEFVSASTSAGTVSTTNSVVTATLGNLASGAVAIITITARATNSGSLVNSAMVAADEFDPNLANNTTSVTTQVQRSRHTIWISDHDGYWDDPTNWQFGNVPQDGDDVVLDRANAAIVVTVRHDVGNLGSLQSAETIFVTNAALSVAAATQIANLQLAGDGTAIAAGGTLNIAAGTSAGAFRVLDGAALNFTGDFALNDGTTFGVIGAGALLVDPAIAGGVVAVNGDVHLPHLRVGPLGALRVNGTLTNQATVTIQGTLSGFGTITGDVTNDGTVAPGSPLGILSIHGNYLQTPGGRLNIELAGVNVGTQYDQLNVAGVATLQGVLNIAAVNDFLYKSGNTFRPLLFGTRLNDFATIQGLTPGGNRYLTSSYDAAGLTLAALQAGILQFSAPTFQSNEGDGVALVIVNRTDGSDGVVSVDYATSDGTAHADRATAGGIFIAADYTRASGSLLFNPGETSKTISIPLLNDSLEEKPETLQLNISNAGGGALLGSQTATTLTILDNDPEVSFQATSASNPESATSATLVVKLSTFPSKVISPLTVDYAVTRSTATGGGVDFTLANGTLNFQNGQTSKNIVMSIVNDTRVEDNETIQITLSNPKGGLTLGANNVFTYTILDNDVGPLDNVANAETSAKPIDLFALPHQVITDFLTSGDKDVFKVTLKNNEFLAIDVDPQPFLTLPGVSASTLSIEKNDGVFSPIITIASGSPEPDTGVASANPAYLFQNTTGATADFFLKLTPNNAQTAGYRMDLRRIALPEFVTFPDPAKLQEVGPMYAFLQNGTLFLTGPSGYGFGFHGNWSKVPTPMTNGRVSETYTATGTVTLMSNGISGVDLTVLGGKFTVTTKGSTSGATFGEVGSLQASFGWSLETLIAKIQPVLDFAGLQFSNTLPNLELSIQMGSDIRDQHDTDQILAGIPYLTFGLTGGDLHFKFASYEFDLDLDAGPEDVALPFIALDPVDPMFYLSLPSFESMIGDFAVGLSPHGMVAFEPVIQSASPKLAALTKLFGQLYVRGGIDLNKLLGLPISISGDFIVNVDADHDGHWFNGHAGTFNDFLLSKLNDFLNVVSDINVGFNGTLKIDLAGIMKKAFGQHSLVGAIYPFELDFDQASLVFNGGQGAFWIAGTETADKPLPGIPLKNLVIKEGATFEFGFFGGNQFFASFAANSDFFGSSLLFAFTIDNSGIHADVSRGIRWVLSKKTSAEATLSGRLDIGIDFRTGKVHYSGSLRANGKVTTSVASATFDIGVVVSDDLLIFNLPIIGRQTFKLP